jgi:hypothetical protein
VSDPQKMARTQEKAIAALIDCNTMAAAAKRAGIDVRSLRRWLDEPEFAKAYRIARGRLVTDVVASLQKAGGAAVAVLKQNLKRGPIPARTKAALGLLDRLFRGTELQDVIARVEALELEAGKR